MMTPTLALAIDFDGVLHRYSRGWQDGTIYDPPIPGAIDALHTLMRDHAVYVHTARDSAQVADWLATHGFTATTDTHEREHHGQAPQFWNERGCVLVTNRKLPATHYIDDRAIHFVSWQQTLHELGISTEGRA